MTDFRNKFTKDADRITKKDRKYINQNIKERKADKQKSKQGAAFLSISCLVVAFSVFSILPKDLAQMIAVPAVFVSLIYALISKFS